MMTHLTDLYIAHCTQVACNNKNWAGCIKFFALGVMGGVLN